MSQVERKLLLSGFISTLSHGEKKTRSREKREETMRIKYKTAQIKLEKFL